ncbi:ribosome maturation factor RimM [Serpentinimonas barnesii]|uniref:ribosome maturation factor RimM n=1 Tax=Serpentinimonas barnesii TaxID=1458427 RepID=UPI0004968507|nr:ribosome maturation factor RimM [Serpentinimonas barnesii]
MVALTGLKPASLPADAVELGRIQEAWGIKGWVRLHCHSAKPEALLHAWRWYLLPPEAPFARGFDAFEGSVEVRVHSIKPHADGLVAQLAEVPDRNAAEALKGARIYVARADFPAAASGDEFYWVDLIGLDVFNRQGEPMGVVRDLLTTGPHSVLCLEYLSAEGKVAERMIPFVSAYVDAVDLAARRITVDWQLDY